MILLAGATNFIGQAVLQHLRLEGYEVRILLEPSLESPYLPPGRPTDVSVASLTDARSVRSAMVGVERVIHAGRGYSYARNDQVWVEAEGARTLAEAARDAGVQRFLYMSHLGADRLSAYPAMRAKAAAEDHLMKSGVPHTILRPALVYGAGDSFTSIAAALMRRLPFILPVPGRPDTLVQPLWVDELSVAVHWALEDASLVGRTIEIGGPEILSMEEIVDLIQMRLGKRRLLVSLAPPFLRFITPLFTPWLLGQFGGEFWIDYFAVNRTTEIDALPRLLGIQPSRMEDCLDYLGT